MKISNLLMIVTLGLFFSTAHATETLPEKSEATKNDIKRDANKAVDRVDEATCTGTDAECAKRKKHLGFLVTKCLFYLVAGAGFEPTTFGL